MGAAETAPATPTGKGKIQVSAIVQFRSQMVKMREEYSQVLPPHMTVDRLNRVVFTAVSAAQKRDGSNPLLEADRRSLLASVMTSAVLGLEPDGVTGQGYLVPFAGRVQFIPGYGGYITLAHNSRILLEGRLVFENDQFSYQYGLNPICNHAPAQRGQERGRIVAAYAVARSDVVPSTFHVAELPDILKIRDRSKGYIYAKRNGKLEDNVWHANFDAMARKTPIRAIGKNMPLNVQRAQALEDAHDRGKLAYIAPDDTISEIDPGDEIPDN